MNHPSHKPKRGSAQPPWHMWGVTETIIVPVARPGTVFSGVGIPTTKQLVQVRYARPESWHFLFATRIVSIDGINVANSGSVTVAWDLTVGLGRSTLQVPSFVTHSASWLATIPGFTMNVLQDPTTLITTSWQGSPAVFNNAGTLTFSGNTPISEIIGQDIQLACRAYALVDDLQFPVSATLQLTGQFSPKNHIRPEWFSEEYPAGEDQGH